MLAYYKKYPTLNYLLDVENVLSNIAHCTESKRQSLVVFFISLSNSN